MPAKKDKRINAAESGRLSTIQSAQSAEVAEKGSSPNFIVDFMQLCDEEGVINVPKIGQLDISSSFTYLEKPSYSVGVTKSSEYVEEEEPTTVFVVYDQADRPDTLRTVFFKGLVLEIGMIAALKRCVPTFTFLSNLRLENCSMTSDMLQALADVVVNNKNICDLSLDMNPIPEQNYYVLFEQESGLQFLSLRLCCLNDDGMELMARELGFKENGQTLIYLNLNYNHLTCEGARHLANALRTNRTLSVILLAGNYIRDEGAIALAEVIRQFPLTHEEVVARRRRNLQRLIMQQNLQLEKKTQQSKTGNLTVKEGSTKSSSTKKKDKETKAGGGREKKKGKEPKGANAPTVAASGTLSVLSDYSVSRLLSKSGVNSEQRRLEQIAEQEITPDLHPYMNNIKQFDGEVWCPGNMKLAYLNISHNRLTNQSVIQFLKAVQYQEVNIQEFPGLITIVLQGNPITDCPELIELLEILAARYGRMENMNSSYPEQKSRQNTSPVNVSKLGYK